ncbi:branched-chain amino acid transport system ATP-binding protein [Microbacteriaceae bacterium SG_E_30_P1]|uniref:Branched-chain amino acid transport system ATP-binding protein n=1 Tax=Antiquaquibacter oligotrophicus TaxID=2880260 RepID=A0ABT6KR61_9MICO|nr:ABC transporter ATP-binding protein [Antiquaquibacter oligotrophicus]MDH6182458.1 branched-chain amino acid transport system ATP-binding protein [Antiquaquibacter oligotrophicus]UDF14571.1 ABC transporter ATP-binding protein [Antiquaquibacter oligotrophicus]
MLVVEDLVVRYGRSPALRGVSFTVNEGEIVTIIGPNGAGKSTALKSIVGLVAPASGRIDFAGRSVVGLRTEALLRQGLSLVPEGRHIFTSLTVAENLRIGATARRDRRAARQDIADMLERFPALQRRVSSPAGKLSGGEQQQLAIARALIARPRMLMLDEPSLGLAPLIVEQIFDIIRELRAEGTTVLLVEQNAAKAVALADRAYVLQSGSVVIHGAASEILSSTEVIDSYFGGAA